MRSFQISVFFVEKNYFSPTATTSGTRQFGAWLRFRGPRPRTREARALFDMTPEVPRSAQIGNCVGTWALVVVASEGATAPLLSSSRLHATQALGFGHWIVNSEFLPDLGPYGTFSESVQVFAVTQGWQDRCLLLRGKAHERGALLLLVLVWTSSCWSQGTRRLATRKELLLSQFSWAG